MKPLKKNTYTIVINDSLYPFYKCIHKIVKNEVIQQIDRELENIILVRVRTNVWREINRKLKFEIHKTNENFQ